MREILFRGKREDTGEWVYGYLVNATWYSDGSPMTMIVPTDADVYPRSEIMYEEVIPETVGQWTGFSDRNCIRIFEGDIVKHQGVVGKITWNEMYYAFTLWKGTGVNAQCHYIDEEYHGDDIFVIGNIHDNPELLMMKVR